MNRHTHVQTDIVLVGGGHAHVHVLARFATRPEPGVRLTLITRDLATPYSGMLPGVVAGLYGVEEAHIDLVRLAAVTGTRLVHAEAIGLDREHKRVALASIAGAAQHAIAVKPIGSFINKFNALREECRRPDGPRRIAVIGGGAGGVELMLSVRARLLADAAASRGTDIGLSFDLVTAGEILEGHNARVRAAFRRVFAAKNIRLHEGRCVRALTSRAIEFDDGDRKSV